ncbi:hypothetical protein FNL55_12550 [Tardiphaga sp. vice352]|uniref:hypothetical protein n=1 Tax=Tardiphaga sp. vice352 TaxID=2592816 RepID=UPI001163F199|nr:hypothetical protein [Tardiphaga sp. vice352]QDM32068.1 hypothetical protein FNL55_12550 [Tardiphaga sp. vice352]
MSRHNRCNRLPPAPSTLRTQATVSALIDSAMVQPRAGLTGAAAVAQLADDMRRSESITRDDLETLGWTSGQLDALAGKARTRAQRLAGASA